jgi:hypothetical protein
VEAKSVVIDFVSQSNSCPQGEKGSCFSDKMNNIHFIVMLQLNGFKSVCCCRMNSPRQVDPGRAGL